MTKLYQNLLIFYFVALLLARDAFAVIAICDPANPYGCVVDFGELMVLIFNILTPLGIALGIFFIIKAGYILMTSEGNPQKTQQGREDLTAAIIGTLFVALSLVILRIIIYVVIGAKPF